MLQLRPDWRVQYQFQKGFRRTLHRARIECCDEYPGYRIPIEDPILPDSKEDGVIVSPVLEFGVYFLASCPAASTREDLTTRYYAQVYSDGMVLLDNQEEAAALLKSRLDDNSRSMMVISEISALEKLIAGDRNELQRIQRSLSNKGAQLTRLREELKALASKGTKD